MSYCTMPSSITSVVQPYANTLTEWAGTNPRLCTITAIALTAIGSASLVAALNLVWVVYTSILTVVTYSLSFSLFAAYAYSSLPQHQLSGSQGAMQPNRVQVMQETLQCMRTGAYTSPDGRRHNLDPQHAANTIEFYSSAAENAAYAEFVTTGLRPQAIHQTQISVVNRDCLDVAQEFGVDGADFPFVANHANATVPGGGYLHGARAQEEECCRRSLLAVIDSQHGFARNFYPLNGVHPSGGLYLNHVTVFRKGPAENYAFMNQPFPAAFGVLAADMHPVLTNGRLSDASALILKNRIRTLLQMAYEHHHATLVLGALGCGAFGNPPDHVAQLFIEVLDEEFRNVFRNIVFAIFDDQNTGATHNPRGNYRPFKERIDAYNVSRGAIPAPPA